MMWMLKDIGVDWRDRNLDCQVVFGSKSSYQNWWITRPIWLLHHRTRMSFVSITVPLLYPVCHQQSTGG